MEIVFTLLATNVQYFEMQLVRMAPLCNTFQIDIQDGIYVPNKTLSAEEVYSALDHLKKTHAGLMEECTFDFHLQVAEYPRSLEILGKMKNRIPVRYTFVHRNFSESGLAPSTQHPTLSTLCPTLSPEDQVSRDMVFLGKSLVSFPAIQIMTIHPGPQGQTFMPEQLEKVHVLRKTGYRGKILIDGGVNPTSIRQIMSLPVTYHPDIVCVGSYLSKAPDHEIGERIEILKALVA